MRVVHYKNIGLPKTGTTWLSLQLSRNPFIDAQVDIHHKEYRPDTFTEYSNFYEKYDVSFNFDINAYMFQDDTNHYLRPENITDYTTHITMSLRNPYELLDSLYNFSLNRGGSQDNKSSYTKIDGDILAKYFNYKKIFHYWSVCKLPIKYMFYDDLCNDPKQYVYDVCDYIGVGRFYSNINFKLETDYKDPLVFDDSKVIDYINDSISVIEEKTNRDLSTWKKQ